MNNYNNYFDFRSWPEKILSFAEDYIKTNRDIISHRVVIALVKYRFAEKRIDPSRYLVTVYLMIIDEYKRRYEAMINYEGDWLWVRKHNAKVVADSYQRIGDELGMQKWKIIALEEDQR